MFEKYRIERQDSQNSPFIHLGETKEIPFADQTCKPGVHYVYRVSGISKDGYSGLPATVPATTQSKGVISGSLELRGDVSFSFLFEKECEKGGDIRFLGTADGRSSASFVNYLGLPPTVVSQISLIRPSSWGQFLTSQIGPGYSFLIPIRGGGTARCKWRPSNRRWGVVLEYEVNPDGALLPSGPLLVVQRKDGFAEIRVTPPKGYPVDTVQVHDSISNDTRTLKVENGLAMDRKLIREGILTYSAIGIDEFGRRSLVSKATLNLYSKEIKRGEFRFHCKQGYSFESQSIVTADEADVYFDSCAGWISSITLTAQGGITNFGRGWGGRSFSRDSEVSSWAIMKSIVAVNSIKFQFGTSAHCHERRPSSDVFILRTRNGGWVKMAIIHRSERGSRTENLVTVRYVYNAWEPVFDKSQDSDLIERGGLTICRKLQDKASREFKDLKDIRERPLIEALINLDKKAKALGDALSKAAGKHIRVNAVLARKYAAALDRNKADTASTFGFESGTRDDMDKSRNDWDFMYGSGRTRIDIRTISDDAGFIWNLGVVDFENLPEDVLKTAQSKEETEALLNHVYIIHTVDSDSDLWSKMKILEIDSMKWMIFQWEVIHNPNKVLILERTPGNSLKKPFVRIQIRAGAAGGNPSRVYMDGNMGACLDKRSPTPLDMKTAPNIRDDCVCYVEGGFIPDGKIFIVERIDFKADVLADSNRGGEFILNVGPYRIAHITDEQQIYTIDRGARSLIGSHTRIKHTVKMEIPIWPGHERYVYAELTDLSLCDVVVQGRFVEMNDHVKWVPKLVKPMKELPSLLFYILQDDGNQRFNYAKENLARFGKENRTLMPFIERILKVAVVMEYLRQLKSLLKAMGGKGK
jgi:hypothetical protein